MYIRSKDKGQLFHKDSKELFADVRCELHIDFKPAFPLPEPLFYKGYFKVIKGYESFDKWDQVVGKIFYLELRKNETYEIVVKSHHFNFEEKEFYFEAKLKM